MLKKTLYNHIKENLKLAIPIIIGQAGHMSASIADNIMVGQVNSVSLASAALANSVFIVLFVFGLGIANGITPLVGTAFGENNIEKCKKLFFNGFITNIIIGVVFSVFMVLSSGIFHHLNQPHEVIKNAIPFYILLSLSMFPYMIFMNFKQFSDGIKQTKQGMIVSISCNLLNIALNFLLIFGMYGFPKMGIIGAGISTLIARILMPIMFYFIFKFSKIYHPYRNVFKFENFSKLYIWKIFQLGFPIGFQFILEVGAFIFGAIMSGWIGANELAAHQIAINLASLTYLMASGIGSAATVRISNLIGAKKYVQARQSGFVSFGLAIVFMGTTALLFMIFNNVLPMVYVKEYEVIVIASKLLLIAAVFQLLDGIQVTGFSALRGLEDVKVPVFMSFISYWVVTVLASYFLAFQFGFGIYGIWYGFVLGLLVAAILAVSRYNYLTKKLIHQ